MSSINQWKKPEHNYSGLYTYAQGPQQDFHLNNKPYVYRSAFKYKDEDMNKPSTMVSDSILNDRVKLKLNVPYSKDGLAKLKSAQKELEDSKRELIHTRLKEESKALSQMKQMSKDTPIGQDIGNPFQYSAASYADTQVLGENNSFGLPEEYNTFTNTEQYAPPSKITIKGSSSNANSSSITTPINQSGLSEYGQSFLDKWGLREEFNNFNGIGDYNSEKKQLAGDGSMEDAFRMLQNSMSSINIKGRRVPKQLQEALVSQIYREQGINLRDILSNRSDGIHNDMIKRKDGSNRVNGGIISYNDTRLTNKDEDGYLDRLNMWKNGQLGNMSRADFEINHLLYDMEKHRPKQYKKLINLLDNPNSTTEDFIKVFDDSIGWVGASFQKTFTPKINKTIANGRRDIAYARKLFNQI